MKRLADESPLPTLFPEYDDVHAQTWSHVHHRKLVIYSEEEDTMPISSDDGTTLGSEDTYSSEEDYSTSCSGFITSDVETSDYEPDSYEASEIDVVEDVKAPTSEFEKDKKLYPLACTTAFWQGPAFARLAANIVSGKFAFMLTCSRVIEWSKYAAVCYLEGEYKVYYPEWLFKHYLDFSLPYKQVGLDCDIFNTIYALYVTLKRHELFFKDYVCMYQTVEEWKKCSVYEYDLKQRIWYQ